MLSLVRLPSVSDGDDDFIALLLVVVVVVILAVPPALFSSILVIVDVWLLSSFVSKPLASLAAEPERYDINPGNIGSMHGERNEAKPAAADTIMFASFIISTTNQLLI